MAVLPSQAKKSSKISAFLKESLQRTSNFGGILWRRKSVCLIDVELLAEHP
jgi:hypothetical protein